MLIKVVGHDFTLHSHCDCDWDLQCSPTHVCLCACVIDEQGTLSYLVCLLLRSAKPFCTRSTCYFEICWTDG